MRGIYILYFVSFIAVAIHFVNCKEAVYATSDGHRYYVNDDLKFNYFEAIRECAIRNMTLATINSESKNEALYAILIKEDISKWLWIAALAYSTEGERKFFWSPTGEEVTYSNWKEGEPNNDNDNEYCVHLEGNLKWNDRNCYQGWGFICELNPLGKNIYDEIECVKEISQK